jgi:hypothetical protein
MLWARASEIDAEDVVFAVKHILRVHNPRVRWHRSKYEAVRNASLRRARHHYPYTMATKMLLKPLGLSTPISRVVAPAAASATRLFFLRSGGHANRKLRHLGAASFAGKLELD